MKSTPSFLVVPLLLFSSCTVRAENLVVNPGFEDGELGWTVFVPPEHAGADADWAVVTEAVHSGAAGASMRAEHPIRWSLSQDGDFAVSPGEKFRITGWIRFGDDAELLDKHGVAFIRLTLFNAAKEGLVDGFGNLHVGINGEVARNASVHSLSVEALPTGWQKISGVVEVPDDTAFVGINLFLHGVVGTAYWDDITFERVPDNTPLSPVIR